MHFMVQPHELHPQLMQTQQPLCLIVKLPQSGQGEPCPLTPGFSIAAGGAGSVRCSEADADAAASPSCCDAVCLGSLLSLCIVPLHQATLL
jgi:hypothetical protein